MTQTLSNKKERILIVDDTPANIDVLGAVLMPDYEISVAVSGPMALEIMDSGLNPDLVLLDVMMPEMDGYEVARRLKSKAETRDIPVIFVTAKIDDEDEANGFRAGGVDYIRKPVNPEVTLARIKAQLELKRLRDHLAREVVKKENQVSVSQKALARERDRLDQTRQDMVGIRADLEGAEASARKNQAYFKELFMNSPHGIILVGPDNKIINSNNSFSRLVGYETQDIINKKTSGFSVAEDLKDAHDSLIAEALAHGPQSMETRCFHKDGYEIHVSALAYPVKINNEVQGVFVFYENIGQRKKFENKLRHQAFHDALTGIPNRLGFAEQLDAALRLQEGCGKFRFAVLLIDLDRFKSVNDTLGHAAGDELLIAVCKKVEARLRRGDTLARMGGDEFAVILSGVRDSREVEMVASRIHQAVEEEFCIHGQEVYISASIGIVYHTRGYTGADQLLRDADLAMYQAKDAGKAGFKFFSPGMRRDLLEQVTLEKELRSALENKELSLFFQPIVRTSDGKTDSFEALVRWRHPEKGVILPSRFIPIAEETGLILPMGDWIVWEACQSLKKLEQGFGQALIMSINISIRQFLKPCFVKRLARQVEEAGIHPSRIKLEFTESMLMANTRSAVEKLNALKSMGFILAVDDFGTGYSSLSYLHQFPIDQIKIDRTFVHSMEEKRESRAIVYSILSLSQGLGLTTVAEGVETREQSNLLAELGCEYAQGYLFSKPCPADQLLSGVKLAGQPG